MPPLLPPFLFGRAHPVPCLLSEPSFPPLRSYDSSFAMSDWKATSSFRATISINSTSLNWCFYIKGYIARERKGWLRYYHCRKKVSERSSAGTSDRKSPCFVYVLGCQISKTPLSLHVDGATPIPSRSDMLPEIAHGIAIGDLHPETQLKLDDNWPHYQPQAGPSRPTPKVATTSTSSFYRQSTPLGNSATKINKSGPLDSFFSRTPTSRGTGGSPSMFLPKPVGFHRSGPARISDLVGRSKSQLTGSPACHYQPSPIVSGASTSKPAESKFFAKFKMASVPVRSQVEIFHDPPPADILLEDLGEACGDQKDKEVEDEDCPLTSPVSISRARSPSPICSALSSPENSPEKKHTFSSPLKGFSILSKRASDLSSPVSMRKRFKRNSEGLAGEGKEGLDLACSSISSPFGEAETGTAVDAKKVEELPTFAATDPFISASTSEHIERKQSVFHASPSLHGQPIDNRDHKGMRHYPIKNELSFSSSPPGFDPKPSQHRSSDVHAHASQIPRTPDDIEEVSDDEEEDILSPRKKRNSSATVGVMHTESVKKVAQGWREKYSFGGIQVRPRVFLLPLTLFQSEFGQVAIPSRREFCK